MIRHVGLSIILLFGMILSVAFIRVSPTQAQSDRRCFPETGYCIAGPIRDFYEQHGDITVFGLPLSPQQEEYIGLLTPTDIDPPIWGQRLQVQRFERNRLELHPDGVVRVGRLGADLLEQQGRSWHFAFPKSNEQPGCRFFPETGHNICGNMLDAWNAYGGIDMIGFPLSDEVQEKLEDNNEYTVQWFERARFQKSPGVGAPFDIELGRLGALDLCTGIPSPINVEVSPSTCSILGVQLDQKFRGFLPNSVVNPWLILPGRVLHPGTWNHDPMVSDDNGEMHGWHFYGIDSRNSTRYVVYQGEGNRTAVMFAKIINPDRTPYYTSLIHACVGLPPSANGFSRPIDANRNPIGGVTPCASQGIEGMQVEAYDFVPGEEIHVKVIDPNGSMNVQEGLIVADSSGIARVSGTNDFPRFRIDEARRQAPGLYIFFLEGTQVGPSGFRNIAAFPIMVADTTPPPPEPPDNLGANKPASYQGNIGINDQVSGRTTSGEAHDWKFSAEAGQVVSIRCDGESGFDSRINLFGADGRWLAADDDGGEGLNSALVHFRLPDNGEYTIRVDEYNGAPGGYTLSLTSP